MTLSYDWKRILFRAWSVRLWALAFVFEGTGLVLPLFVDDMPRSVFSALSLVSLAGGLWARVTKQKGFY